MGHLMAAVSTPMVIVNGGFNIERWRPLSNFVEIVEAGLETATGQVEDVPPAVVLAAASGCLPLIPGIIGRWKKSSHHGATQDGAYLSQLLLEAASGRRA